MSTKVSSREFQREFGRYRTMAHREAVTITNHGRDDVVLVDAEEYSRLKAIDTDRYKTTAVYTSELSEEFVEEMLAEPIPEEAEQFNDEYPAPAP